jgi:hypothetical protein
VDIDILSQDGFEKMREVVDDLYAHAYIEGRYLTTQIVFDAHESKLLNFRWIPREIQVLDVSTVETVY